MCLFFDHILMRSGFPLILQSYSLDQCLKIITTVI